MTLLLNMLRSNEIWSVFWMYLESRSVCIVKVYQGMMSIMLWRIVKLHQTCFPKKEVRWFRIMVMSCRMIFHGAMKCALLDCTCRHHVWYYLGPHWHDMCVLLALMYESNAGIWHRETWRVLRLQDDMLRHLSSLFACTACIHDYMHLHVQMLWIHTHL